MTRDEQRTPGGDALGLSSCVSAFDAVAGVSSGVSSGRSVQSFPACCSIAERGQR